MASKYHTHKNKGVKLVLRPKSLKCKLGLHFPYNAIGWPMVEIKPKCLYCEAPLKNMDRTIVEKISRVFLNMFGRVHWFHRMVPVYSFDSDKKILECDFVGCSHRVEAHT